MDDQTLDELSSVATDLADAATIAKSWLLITTALLDEPGNLRSEFLWNHACSCMAERILTIAARAKSRLRPAAPADGAVDAIALHQVCAQGCDDLCHFGRFILHIKQFSTDDIRRRIDDRIDVDALIQASARVLAAVRQARVPAQDAGSHRPGSHQPAR